MSRPRLPIAHPVENVSVEASLKLTAMVTGDPTARPVAVDALDQDVVGRVLDGDALVSVRDFDVVHPDIGSRYVDAVEATLVAATDDSVVQLAVGTLVEREVELRCCGY